MTCQVAAFDDVLITLEPGTCSSVQPQFELQSLSRIVVVVVNNETTPNSLKPEPSIVFSFGQLTTLTHPQTSL
jgi:hypothetical protein